MVDICTKDDFLSQYLYVPGPGGKIINQGYLVDYHRSEYSYKVITQGFQNLYGKVNGKAEGYKCMLQSGEDKTHGHYFKWNGS